MRLNSSAAAEQSCSSNSPAAQTLTKQSCCLHLDKPYTWAVLLRLSPIVPFNALNYALGITEMRFLSYAVRLDCLTCALTVLHVL